MTQPTKSKILYSLVSILVAFCLAFTAGGTFSTGAGGGEAETYSFYWTADYASDTDKAYIQAGASTQDGTYTGGAASDVQNHTDGGTYSGLFDAAGENIAWTVTNDDIINDAEGRAEIWVWSIAHTGDRNLWQLTSDSYDSQNFISANLNSSNQVLFYHRGNNVMVSITTTATISDEAWTRIRFRWSAANNVVSVKVGDGSWENDSDGDAVTAHASAQTTLYAGERHVVNHTNGVYLDDVKVWTTYDAAW